LYSLIIVIINIGEESWVGGLVSRDFFNQRKGSIPTYLISRAPSERI
jgi:hypothetical protein